MKKSKFLSLVATVAAVVLMMAACSSPSSTSEPANSETSQVSSSSLTSTPDGSEAQPTTVEITDIHGTVTVPVNPKNVVSLDNRTFETLADWGIELVAVPKSVMPSD